MSYSMDTSALIEAWVRSYPPDVFSNLWQRFEQLIADGRLLAVDEVLRELKKKEDDLAEWAGRQKALFVPLDENLQRRAAPIINRFETLTNAPTVMRGAADPFVIALAAERGLAVVTAERSKPTKPRIPDVCQVLDIECITLVELFRREDWRGL
ncbi:MAG: DUF4411 family protein [bacterium]|nr:DUF4411 family protein [bacterium]